MNTKYQLYLILTMCLAQVGFAGTSKQPNILLIISDDQSWEHASAYGCQAIETPAFDRVASEGILFKNAYSAAPQCAPSRGALLTGRNIWELESGAVQRSFLPAKFTGYPTLLRDAGYHVGYSGKGWGPGSSIDRTMNPAGLEYDDFRAFLEKRKEGQPFCFWFGSKNPHRPYTDAETYEIDFNRIEVPRHLPDHKVVIDDLASYLSEIVAFDNEIETLLQLLASIGEVQNTIVVITSDNGMPFPRGKCNLYDYGVRVPLAICWPAEIEGQRVVDDFVSLADLAPTFLEAAGVAIPIEMSRKGFINVLTEKKTSGLVDLSRDHIVLGRERHSVTRPDQGGYPIRSIRTLDYLYIHNLRPDRGPTGDPPGTADTNPSPTDEFMLDPKNADYVSEYFELCFGRRPEFELYDLRKDPEQLINCAGNSEYDSVRETLSTRLEAYLRLTNDPRITGDGPDFDSYPFWWRESERIYQKRYEAAVPHVEDRIGYPNEVEFIKALSSSELRLEE